MVAEPMARGINAQINREMYSANHYLSLAVQA
jgi:ferritin